MKQIQKQNLAIGQMQNIYGGKQISTFFRTSSDWAMHDNWNDKNNDGKLGPGDILDIWFTNGTKIMAPDNVNEIEEVKTALESGAEVHFL